MHGWACDGITLDVEHCFIFSQEVVLMLRILSETPYYVGFYAKLIRTLLSGS